MRVLGHGTPLAIVLVSVKHIATTMTIFSLADIIQLGPLKGKTIKDAIQTEPAEFISFINQHESLRPDNEAQTFMNENGIPWNMVDNGEQEDSFKEDFYEEEFCHRLDDDDPYPQTYEKYNGSYAQDEMGWSDQTIDDALDGDPDLYWNID